MQIMVLAGKDLQLVYALQVWPRAPWSRLGPILDVDPVTLARRWSTIGERRLAWTTCQPRQISFRHGAIVEVECVSGSVNKVVADLSRDRSCISIDVVSGGRSLILTIGCTTAANLNRYLISQLGEMSGVRSVRTNPVVATIAGAVQWRVNALLEAQVAAIEAAQRAADRQMEDRAAMSASSYRAVIEILCHDGRATSTLIGKRLGIRQRRAREYLHSTLMSGLIELRTDVLRQESGWPVSAWYFLRVPAANLREVGVRLRTLRTVRTILSVAGPANVLVLAWLPSIEEVEGLEIAMEQALPSVRIVDRSLVLAVRKRVGRTFDDDELPLDLVPWELAQFD